jgi:hypothetical protein
MPPTPTLQDIIHPADWRELLETGVRVVAEFALHRSVALPQDAFEVE